MKKQSVRVLAGAFCLLLSLFLLPVQLPADAAGAEVPFSHDAYDDMDWETDEDENSAKYYDDYYVKNWDFDITVNKDGSLDVTETVDAFFNEYRHGFTRWVMQDVTFFKETSDDDGEWHDYHAKISRVKADDLAKQETENRAKVFCFGSSGNLVAGDQTYHYSYRYDLGPDGFDGYDVAYQNLNGADCSVYIDHMTFRITFPKEFDTDAIRFYSGKYGDDTFNDSSTLTYTVNGNVIEGHTLRTLEPGESVTLQVRLPEGYFSKYRMNNVVLVLLLSAGALLLLLAGALLRRKYRTHPVVPTVEFYPPEGVTPAEVGYIIDGVTSNEELMSMVVWYAEKGYLKIKEDENKKIWLTRTQKEKTELVGYEKKLLTGLFDGAANNKVCLNNAGEEFYNVLTQCRALLPTEYRAGEKRLEDKGVRGKAGGIIALLTPLAAGMVWLSSGGFSFIASVVMAAASAVAVLTQGFVTLKMRRERGFLSKGTKTLLYLCRIVSAAVICGCALTAGLIGVVPFWLPLLCAAVIVWTLHLVGNSFYPTSYYIALAGKLIGFRSFIEKAELPRIEKLAEQDPEYFFKVLPYAYVFGLSDVWMDRFEKLATPPPTPSWYVPYGNSYNRYWMRNIYHSYGAAISSATSAYAASRAAAASSHSGGGFSGGGFSGGGFSGGGGGGGGCGSW